MLIMRKLEEVMQALGLTEDQAKEIILSFLTDMNNEFPGRSEDISLAIIIRSLGGDA